MKRQRSPMAILFITIFVDLVGFGMIIPLSPYVGREYGASTLQVGLLLSAYSLAQIIFSPLWGRWSDRIGRRPIILMSLVGTGLSHVAFAYSGALWMLFVSRTLSGIFGANISTAMAYAADVTENKDRSKGMGILGAAFGLGFIFGPFFGGMLGVLGTHISMEPPFGHSFPALCAGLLCFLNVSFAYFALPESLPEEKRSTLPPRQSKLKLALEYFSRPVTGPLLLVTFLAQFAMSQMEGSLFLLVHDKFNFDLADGSYAFAFIGIVMTFTQGFLIRSIQPVTGDRKLLFWGSIMSGLALTFVGVSGSLIMLAIVMTVMSIGFGLRMPSLNGTISMSCSPQEQGAVMGVNQGLQALGRVLGPPLSGWLYGAFGTEVTFFVAGFFGLLGVPIIWKLYKVIPDSINIAKDETTNAIPKPAELPKTVTQFEAPKKKEATQVALPPQPIVIPDRPRTPRPAVVELPKIEHVRKEDRITLISAFQFRSLFTNNVNFLFFDLRGPDAVPQYSRAVKTTETEAINEINKRTQDKRAPVLLLCEDGAISKEVAKKIADFGFINVVIVEGGARALNKTGHV